MTPVLMVAGLLLLGLALVAVEVILIPGFGVVGVLGLASILGAGALAYFRLSPASALAALICGLVLGGLLLWLLPKTRWARSMVLATSHEGQAADPGLKGLLGFEGVTLTPLRPSGSARIDQRQVDVISDGQFIEAGQRVRVMQVQGARVVVEPLGADDDGSG